MKLSKQDINFLTSARTLVSSAPMLRKQGNGNFTGFTEDVYSDGLVLQPKFIMNAQTPDEVRRAYILQRSN